MASKFVDGGGFGDVYDLIRWIESGEWTYWRGKTTHPQVLFHLQLGTLLVSLRYLRKAVEPERVCKGCGWIAARGEDFQHCEGFEAHA